MTSPELEISPQVLFKNHSKIDCKNENLEYYYGEEISDNNNFQDENGNENENDNDNRKEVLIIDDSHEHENEITNYEKKERKKKSTISRNVIDASLSADDVISNDVTHNGENGFMLDTEIDKGQSTNISCDGIKESKNQNQNQNLISTPIPNDFYQIDAIQDSDCYIEKYVNDYSKKKNENSENSDKNEKKNEIRQTAANEQNTKEVRPKKFRKSSRSVQEQGVGIRIQDPVLPRYESLKRAIKIRFVRNKEIKMKE